MNPILYPHSRDWAGEFSALKTILLATLGFHALAIEHVGSTAIPGLAAKPILDIDVVIENPAALAPVIDRLAPLGYRHEANQPIAQREAFKRLDDDVPWQPVRRKWVQQHLYVCPADSLELRRHLRFRDTLRAHPALAADYEALKRGIEARAGGSRKVYADIKEIECRAFVEHVLTRDR